MQSNLTAKSLTPSHEEREAELHMKRHFNEVFRTVGKVEMDLEFRCVDRNDNLNMLAISWQNKACEGLFTKYPGMHNDGPFTLYGLKPSIVFPGTSGKYPSSQYLESK